jgi:hypothetical protein
MIPSSNAATEAYNLDARAGNRLRIEASLGPDSLASSLAKWSFRLYYN